MYFFSSLKLYYRCFFDGVCRFSISRCFPMELGSEFSTVSFSTLSELNFTSLFVCSSVLWCPFSFFLVSQKEPSVLLCDLCWFNSGSPLRLCSVAVAVLLLFAADGFILLLSEFLLICCSSSVFVSVDLFSSGLHFCRSALLLSAFSFWCRFWCFTSDPVLFFCLSVTLSSSVCVCWNVSVDLLFFF